MARFFIDLHDGANFVRDGVGFDLADEAEVRAKLVRIMAKIAQGLAPGPERQDFLAVVRNDRREVILRAHLRRAGVHRCAFQPRRAAYTAQRGRYGDGHSQR